MNECKMLTDNAVKHIAIIADGNRRWAIANGLPKEVGHAQGLTVIERCCEWAINSSVPYLTVYCFSTENWNREQAEVNHIMDLARHYFEIRREWYVGMGIRVRFIGRRDRLASDIVEKLCRLERDTADCTSMTLTICVDYGGRDEIARAVCSGARTEEEITAILTKNFPDPDIIFRTGGQQRLSNFLLWQSAYAELFFSSVLFPDLEAADLDTLIKQYNDRKRNYGR